MRYVRNGTFLAGLFLVLGAANYSILSNQKVVSEGREVVLKLRPVDPRSLIQGDYMILRYDKAAFPAKNVINSLPYSGTAVLALDANNRARFVRFDNGKKLGENETRLRFRRDFESGELRYGAESFFFQEGHVARFSDAEYGILRVDASGNSVLVGLADEAFGKIADK